MFEIPADGGESRLVVEDRGFFDYRAGLSFGTPLPSPDGAWVLFRSVRNGWHNFWVVPREGGEPRAIAADEARAEPRALVAGRQRDRLRVEPGRYPPAARRLRRRGGAPRELVGPTPMGAVAKPEWSPDGTSTELHAQHPDPAGRPVRRRRRHERIDPPDPLASFRARRPPGRAGEGELSLDRRLVDPRLPLPSPGARSR